jgi:hypothetical protein
MKDERKAGSQESGARSQKEKACRLFLLASVFIPHPSALIPSFR